MGAWVWPQQRSAESAAPNSISAAPRKRCARASARTRPAKGGLEPLKSEIRHALVQLSRFAGEQFASLEKGMMPSGGKSGSGTPSPRRRRVRHKAASQGSPALELLAGSAGELIHDRCGEHKARSLTRGRRRLSGGRRSMAMGTDLPKLSIWRYSFSARPDRRTSSAGRIRSLRGRIGGNRKD